MDYLVSHIPCSPYFPANPESFTFDSKNLTTKQKKRNTNPSITSPLNLNKQTPADTLKDNQSNFTLQSPGGEFNLISFKENKMSPSNNNVTDCSQSPLLDLNMTNSIDNPSSSRNNNGLSIALIDMKDNTFSLPKSKYSSKYQSDQTIKEDPNEDSFNHKKNKQFKKEYSSIQKKDHSSIESKRMITELLKIINLNDDLIEKYQIDINTFIPYYFLRANLGNLGIEINNNILNVKIPDLGTCSTKDNDEELDEETRLICFMSIPRIVHLYYSKQLMCISPCACMSKNSRKINEEVYSIIFKHVDTLKIIEIISFKAITSCERKSNVVFGLQFIQNKTFLKKVYNIETQSLDDCVNYANGINTLIQKNSRFNC